jgi:UDP-glucuronate 4-epimerase
MRVLVTGAAGFIGFHTSRALLRRGETVVGYDNVNDYYDPAVKHARLEELSTFESFHFTRGDITDADALAAVWSDLAPTHVVHLAAQAGVRYSIENPMAYVRANLDGFQHVIELARAHRPENFVYASSSSVYGGNKEMPFSESQRVDNPISLYAATKASNELVARAYGNLYDLPTTGLRFFTAYGPFGRPDMAMYKFAELMLAGKPIPVFNHGEMIRDFTYVDDIVQGILAALEKPQRGAVYNLGRGDSMELMDMIQHLEQHLGVKAEVDMLPMQPGDVPATLADISKARLDLGYEPQTDTATGIGHFVRWFLEWKQASASSP